MTLLYPENTKVSEVFIEAIVDKLNFKDMDNISEYIRGVRYLTQVYLT